jgi:D-alanyl-D-alanine dipeptidase
MANASSLFTFKPAFPMKLPASTCILIALLAVFLPVPAFASENIDFVDVRELDDSFILDIRYATQNNFTGQQIYPVSRCLLRRDAALRLVRVQQALRKKGYRLVIYDCYRPLSVQIRFWQILPDERYVADPVKGSRHNRGAAVDVSLADSNGMPLPMPTGYDDFSDKAHRDYRKASPEAMNNRVILENAMKNEGFLLFPTEWWHFDAPGWERYPVSNFPLQKSRSCGE